MSNHRASHYVMGAVTALLLSIFATPALMLAALCAAPVIVAFTPWLIVSMWKSAHAAEHHHDYPEPHAQVRTRVVFSGPVDHSHAHA